MSRMLQERPRRCLPDADIDSNLPEVSLARSAPLGAHSGLHEAFRVPPASGLRRGRTGRDVERIELLELPSQLDHRQVTRLAGGELHSRTLMTVPMAGSSMSTAAN